MWVTLQDRSGKVSAVHLHKDGQNTSSAVDAESAEPPPREAPPIGGEKSDSFAPNDLDTFQEAPPIGGKKSDSFAPNDVETPEGAALIGGENKETAARAARDALPEATAIGGSSTASLLPESGVYDLVVYPYFDSEGEPGSTDFLPTRESILGEYVVLQVQEPSGLELGPATAAMTIHFDSEASPRVQVAPIELESE